MKGQVTIITLLNVSMGLFGTIATTNYVRGSSRWIRWSINIMAGFYKPSGTYPYSLRINANSWYLVPS
jgi:hypothetical protein